MDILNFIVFFVQLYFVSAMYYTSAYKEISLPEDSQIVQARSTTECVLKCLRLTREAFYTDDEKCVCIDGMTRSNSNQNKFTFTIVNKSLTSFTRV